MRHRSRTLGAALFAAAVAASSAAQAAEVLAPASQRYADAEVREVPDFQRHVLPLMGRLGCNSRSCHGSFQGQGGFRLSLFGYDFEADHKALLLEGSERVDPEFPEGSKVIRKPTLAMPHKGGKRLEPDSWQYTMFVRWMEEGARGVSDPVRFDRLEMIPSEIVFQEEGERVPLRVIAHWADGAREDVTCITRFRTNDESIAEIDEDGVVTSVGRGDTHVVAFYDNGVSVTQVIRPVSDKVGPDYPAVPTPTRVDALVVAKLSKLGIVPSAVADDEEFLRRVSLDMTGSLPAPDEIKAFLADGSADKRARKIDELLERPTYAARWATKLCDITGDTPRGFQGQPAATEMARSWYAWIERRVAENTPYDDLIAGIVLGTSREPGQDYGAYTKQESAYYHDGSEADYADRETMPYFWARRNIRKPEEKALNFSYAFLGVRLECAQCHKHPFDQWTQDDFNRFTGFFEGITYGTPTDARDAFKAMQEDLNLSKNGGEARRQVAKLLKEGKTVPFQEVYIRRTSSSTKGRSSKDDPKAKTSAPRVLGGEEVDLASGDDPREPIMEWMRREDNPYFARAFVNRVWAEYFQVGIINPPDDMNQANPPSNQALLDHLARGFVAQGFDMKWLHREIANSLAYQRTWRPNETNRLDERNFSRASARRLPAETLLDAVVSATAGPDDLARATTDLEERAIGPKLGSGTPRGGNDYAARVFGRSTRDTNCDCSASDEPNLLQSIFLQNDQEIFAALDRKGGWLDEIARSPADAALAEADDLERKLDKLRDGGKGKDMDKDKDRDRREAARRLEDRIADLRHEAKESRRAASLGDVDEVIREAYLRSLSREPEAGELELARAHLDGADDARKGLRDLMWALLNTKEFITNH